MALFSLALITTICFIAVISHKHNEHQPHHECTHDHDTIIRGENLHQFTIPYKNHPYDKTVQNAIKNMPNSSTSINNKDRRSLLTKAQVQPIRISAYYDPNSITNHLSANDQAYIKSVMNAVINYYTDAISIIPVDGTWFFQRQCYLYYNMNGYKSCTSYFPPTCLSANVPDEHIGDALLYDANSETASTLPGGVGVSNTDLVIYVTYYSTSTCSGNTLAYAGPCALDQYGRPMAGNINICPKFLQGAEAWKEDVQTILHEMSHVTVMSSGLWHEFKDTNGNTMLYSDVVTYDDDLETRVIITDKVKTMAQEHFNCDTNVIKGLPLVNDTAHWHFKWVHSETLTAIIYGASHYFSKFTLALMEDSGWYLPNYEYAEPYYFGWNEGCLFFRQTCININTENARFDRNFCDNSLDDGCNADYSAPAFCVISTGNNIPLKYQYFASDSSKGGPEQANYCPIRDPSGNDYESICWDERGNNVAYDTAVYSEVWGSSSRCTVLTGTNGNSGYCLVHNCYGYNATLSQFAGVTITVNGENITCLQGEDGIIKNVNGINNRDLKCPVVDIVCRNGFGECYFGHYNVIDRICVCSPGYTGTDCNTKYDDSTDNTVVLAVSRVPTTSPTNPTNNVCVEGFPWSNYNGEWNLDSVYNNYGAYDNPLNTRYLFWNIFQHEWIIGGSIGAVSYNCYCGVSEFTEDIGDCNGNWYCYGSTGWVKYPETMTYFGSCTTTTALLTCDNIIDSYDVVYDDVNRFREARQGQGYLDTVVQSFVDDPNYSQCEGTVDILDYKYDFIYRKPRNELTVSLIVCCGGAGATFEVNYQTPVGYSAYGTGEAFAEDDWETQDVAEIKMKWIILIIVGCIVVLFCTVAVILYRCKVKRKTALENKHEMDIPVNNKEDFVEGIATEITIR
eukprot:287368_1